MACERRRWAKTETVPRAKLSHAAWGARLWDRTWWRYLSFMTAGSPSRALSFWGWGYEDRFADAETRKGIALQVGALLGRDGLVPREPPRIDDVRMPTPRIAPPESIASFASATIPDRARHTYGKSYRDIVRGFHGDFGNAPDFVVRPRNEDELSRVLEACTKLRIAAIPFGGGTSVVGGVEG